MKKLKITDIGKKFEITFLDHAEGGLEVSILECKVFGELAMFTEEEMVIVSWASEDTSYEGNQAAFAIVRAAVTKMKELK